MGNLYRGRQRGCAEIFPALLGVARWEGIGSFDSVWESIFPALSLYRRWALAEVGRPAGAEDRHGATRVEVSGKRDRLLLQKRRGPGAGGGRVRAMVRSAEGRWAG